MGGIFCDLAKAFDYVNHEILLLQLQFYGIPDVAEDWYINSNWYVWYDKCFIHCIILLTRSISVRYNGM